MKRINLTLEDNIADMLLELAGSQRKQSDYISDLIRLVYDNEGYKPGNTELSNLKFLVGAHSSKLDTLEHKYAVLEEKFDEFRKAVWGL